MKSWIERGRKYVSWSTAICIGLLAGLCPSRWEKSHADALLLAVACVLVALATVGRLWCTLYIAGMKTRTLVTEGPYSMSRNPLYFYSMLGMLGVGLATETFTIPLLLLVGFALYYPHVIRSEEARLAALHGAAFTAYRERVSAFLPRRSTFSEPEKLLINAKKFRRAVFHALWFVWLVGLFEIAEALRDVGWLPSLYRLY